jgi:hypothetical protein
MTIDDVRLAVTDAVRHFGFGASYLAPLEIAQVSRDGTSAIYSAVFNDLRQGHGPAFSIDIDTTMHATLPAMRDYVVGRITAYFGEPERR